MDFDIDAFTQSIRLGMEAKFPYENDRIKKRKHKNTLLHIVDVAFRRNPTRANGDERYFEIGNQNAEAKYPYYHILQDAPVIRKKGKADKGTKGSQASVADLGLRDYNKITYDGKRYKREYEKNIRGSRRSVVDNATQWVDGVKINRGSNSYKNIHYKYIDNMLPEVCQAVAGQFGLIYVGIKHTSLEEDYLLSLQLENDENTSILSDIISHL